MLPPRIDQATVRNAIGPYADQEQTIEQRGAVYKELLGFVPPRIEARLHVTGALDPTMLDLQEQIRAHGMYPKCFDIKTSQLMLFGMLLMDLNDAAPLHGIAARRAGASWEELQGVINLCFLFRGTVRRQSGSRDSRQYRQARGRSENRHDEVTWQTRRPLPTKFEQEETGDSREVQFSVISVSSC